MTSPLLRWLDAAQTDRGIHYAGAEGSWTFQPYRELARRTLGTAAALRAGRLVPGARVAVVARTGPEFVSAFFGILAAGGTPAPLATPAAFQTAGAYASHLTGALLRAGASALLADADLAGELRPAAAAAGVATHAIEAVYAEPGDAWTGWSAEDLALVQFTSGSSGTPRAVEVPHRALAANVEAIRVWLAMTAADPVASWLPVHHDMGLIGCLVAPVVSGCDLWLMRPEQFVRRPAAYLRCLSEHRVRLTAMPAFGLAYLLRRVPPQAGLDLSALRAVVVGAERLDPAVLERFSARFGLAPDALRPAYGLAESTLMVTGLALGDRWRRAGELAGSGVPLGGARVSVRDDTAELPEGAIGEIVVEGPSVARGYAGRPPDPDRFRGGQLHTGDAGFLREGQLYVLGRLGDALKIHGRLLFAEDLEATLVRAGMPARDVVVLLGGDGSGPVAVAVLERARPDLLGLADRVLRRSVPDVRVLVRDAPPGSILRTTSGKPRRRAMWQRFLADSPIAAVAGAYGGIRGGDS